MTSHDLNRANSAAATDRMTQQAQGNVVPRINYAKIAEQTHSTFDSSLLSAHTVHTVKTYQRNQRNNHKL